MNETNLAIETARKYIQALNPGEFVRKALSYLYGSLERSGRIGEEVTLPLIGAAFLVKKTPKLGFSSKSAEWNKPIRVNQQTIGWLGGFRPEVLVLNLNNKVDLYQWEQLVPGLRVVELGELYTYLLDSSNNRIGFGDSEGIGKLNWQAMPLALQDKLVQMAIMAAERSVEELIPAHPGWLVEKDESGNVKQVRILLAKRGTLQFRPFCDRYGIDQSSQGTIFMRAGKDIWKAPTREAVKVNLYILPDEGKDRDGSIYLKPGKILDEGEYGLVRGTAWNSERQLAILKGRLVCNEWEASHLKDADKSLPADADGWCRAGNFKWSKVEPGTVVAAKVWMVKEEVKEAHKDSYGVTGGFLIMDQFAFGKEYVERLFKTRTKRVLNAMAAPTASLLAGSFREEENNLIIEGNLARHLLGFPVSRAKAAKGLLDKLRGVRDPQTAYASVIFTDTWNGKELKAGEVVVSKAILDRMPEKAKEKGFGFSRYPKTSHQSFCKVRLRSSEETNGMEGDFVIAHPAVALYTQGDDDDHALLTFRFGPEFDPESGEDPAVRAEAHKLSDLPLTLSIAYLKGEYFRSQVGLYTNLLYRSVAIANRKYGKGSEVVRKLESLVGKLLDICVQGAKKHIAEPNYSKVHASVIKLISVDPMDGDILLEMSPEGYLFTTKNPPLDSAQMAIKLVWGLDPNGDDLILGQEGELGKFAYENKEAATKVVSYCAHLNGELWGRNATEWHRNIVRYLTAYIFKKPLSLNGEEAHWEIVSQIGELDPDKMGDLYPYVDALLRVYYTLMKYMYTQADNMRLGYWDRMNYNARANAMSAGVGAILAGYKDPIG